MELLSYSFFTILAAVTVILGAYRVLNKANIPKRKIIILLTFTLISTLIGARTLHIITNPTDYQQGVVQYLDLGFYGFSLYGGLILATITGIIVSVKLHLDIWKIADHLAPLIGIGIAIMRIGCFIEGCCFGTETSLPWGYHFPIFSPAHLHQLRQLEGELLTVRSVHPTQLYELVAALTASLIAWWCLKKNYSKGIASIAFIIWLTIWRWVIYYLREPSLSYIMPDYFLPSLYIITLGLSVVILSEMFKMPMISRKK